jgi:hypothetical protein
MLEITDGIDDSAPLPIVGRFLHSSFLGGLLGFYPSHVRGVFLLFPPRVICHHVFEMDTVLGTKMVEMSLFLGFHLLPVGREVDPKLNHGLAGILVFAARAETKYGLVGVGVAPPVDEFISGCGMDIGDGGLLGHLIFSLPLLTIQ